MGEVHQKGGHGQQVAGRGSTCKSLPIGSKSQGRLRGASREWWEIFQPIIVSRTYPGQSHARYEEAPFPEVHVGAPKLYPQHSC